MVIKNMVTAVSVQARDGNGLCTDVTYDTNNSSKQVLESSSTSTHDMLSHSG